MWWNRHIHTSTVRWFSCVWVCTLHAYWNSSAYFGLFPFDFVQAQIMQRVNHGVYRSFSRSFRPWNGQAKTHIISTIKRFISKKNVPSHQQLLTRALSNCAEAMRSAHTQLLCRLKHVLQMTTKLRSYDRNNDKLCNILATNWTWYIINHHTTADIMRRGETEK